MSLEDYSPLLEAVDQEQPAGPSLEYDADFQQLQQDLAPAKLSMVDSDAPAESKVNWDQIADKAHTLLAQSKDIHLAIWLSRAALHKDGFAGLAAGIELLTQLITQFWATVHPVLDADDDNDATMRMNSLLLLVEPDGLLADLRNVAFLKSMRLGELNLRKYYVSEGKISQKDDEESVEKSYVESLLQDVGQEAIEGLHQALSTIEQSRKAMDDKVSSELGSAELPNLQGFDDEIRAIQRLLKPYLAAGATVEGGEDTAESPSSGAAGKAANGVGGVNSTSDVVRVIDMICDYYKKSEPSSPVPLLLERAKRLVDKNFIDIINDIAPKGLEEAKHISGTQE